MPNLLSPSILEDPRRVGKKMDSPRPRAYPQKPGIFSQIGLRDERVTPEGSERQSNRSVTARRTPKDDTADCGRQTAEGGYSKPRSAIPHERNGPFPKPERVFNREKRGKTAFPEAFFAYFRGFRPFFVLHFSANRL
jgi:hypothetical protein